jgi:hypothetical protein
MHHKQKDDKVQLVSIVDRTLKSCVVYEANDGNDYSYLYKFSGRLSGQFTIYLFRLSSRLILVGYC